MAIDPGNSLRTARNLGTLTTRRLGDRVGGSDKFDFYKFTIKSLTNVRASLRGLQADADMAILNSSGRLMQQDRKPGTQNERLGAILEPGVYYLRLQGRRQVTPYTVNLVAKSVVPNVTPTLGGSLALSALRGSVTPSSTTIDSTSLNATDAQQSADQLVYTITTAPKQGSVFRNGVLLSVGSTFTQADVNNNLISYQQQAIKPLPNSTGITSNIVISGNNAAWISGAGTNAEVFFYNGTTGVTTQLSNDSRADESVQISGDTVVWASRYGSTDRDIRYSINGGSATTIDGSAADDFDPAISDSYIAFKRNDTSGTNVVRDGLYLFNIGTGSTTQLRENVEDIYAIGVSSTPAGVNVVWQRFFPGSPSGGGESNIQYSINDGLFQSVDGQSILDDFAPRISDQYIAFQRNNRAGSNTASDGLYLFDISTPRIAPIALELGTEAIDRHRLFENNVVWERAYTADRDVRYSIAGSAARAIDFSTSLDDYNAFISGSNIVFQRNQIGGDAVDGIYFFNVNSPPTSPIRLSNSSLDEIGGIDGHNVVFRSGSQAFFYDGNTTSDSFGFTISDGSLSANGTLNISIAS